MEFPNYFAKATFDIGTDFLELMVCKNNPLKILISLPYEYRRGESGIVIVGCKYYFAYGDKFYAKGEIAEAIPAIIFPIVVPGLIEIKEIAKSNLARMKEILSGEKGEKLYCEIYHGCNLQCRYTYLSARIFKELITKYEDVSVLLEEYSGNMKSARKY